MLHYNLPLLLELLTNIGRLVNATVTLYDENFIPTRAYSSNFENPFCNTLKEHFYNKCLLSDLNAHKHLTETNEPCYYYTCHFGLTERTQKDEKVYCSIKNFTIC